MITIWLPNSMLCIRIWTWSGTSHLQHGLSMTSHDTRFVTFMYLYIDIAAVEDLWSRDLPYYTRYNIQYSCSLSVNERLADHFCPSFRGTGWTFKELPIILWSPGGAVLTVTKMWSFIRHNHYMPKLTAVCPVPGPVVLVQLLVLHVSWYTPHSIHSSKH